MAQPDPLPAAARTAVAQQLGPLMAGGHAAPAAAAAGAATLGGSLTVCIVGADQVTNPPADLAVLARPSGLWHHQIHTAAGLTHMAQSRQQGFTPDALDVEALAESPIAEKIDRAMTWVDQHVPDDGVTARLLVIPAYYVHALLLVHPDRCTAVLADQPPGFTRLKYDTEYPLGDFLSLLAGERKSVSMT